MFGGVSNLTVTAVGAGMLALPKAFATVGVAFGLGLFVFVCFLTYFSTGIVVRQVAISLPGTAGAGLRPPGGLELTLLLHPPSTRFAAQHKKSSYGDLIKETFGETGAVILRLAIIVHVGGELKSGEGQLAEGGHIVPELSSSMRC